MWQTICILAEGLLHLICFVGLMAAIGIVCVWGFGAYVMIDWMKTQSGHGVRFVQNKKMGSDTFCNGLPPASRNKSENVVKMTGVM